MCTQILQHMSASQHARTTAHDHGHGHGHGHGQASLLSRVAHAVGDVLGAHSHDTVDQVDDAMEATTEGRRALYLSLVILLVTAGLQAVVVTLSGSVALLGDTLHNLADALTAVPLLVAFRLGLRAADDRFTYGYGRAEDLAGIFVVAMIALSSALAAYEAVRRLLDPQPVGNLWAVAAAALVGFVGNEWVAYYRIRVGRRIGSAALVADGLHARTDGITSLAVLLGVIGSALGWHLADPIVGLVITVAIVGILRSAMVQVGSRLMDAVDPTLVATARHAAAAVEGVHDVSAVRLRWVGHALRGEVEVGAAGDVPLTVADALAEQVTASLRDHLPRLADTHVRVRAAASCR
ncbi:MAG: cation transporter [Nocardioides sp.]|nr:cation transporter [Nocardioides sp.]